MNDRSAQISALYESTLKPRLAALENSRRELTVNIVKSLILAGVPFLLFVVASSLVPEGLVMAAEVGAFALIFVAIGIAGMRYLVPGYTAYKNYSVRYKREVVSEIFRIVAPTATYEPFKGIAETVFDEPGIFATRGGFDSDDRVRGRIGKTPFEAAEVRRAYTTSTTSTSAGTRSATTHLVFHGLFFHLDGHRAMRGTTIVQPRRSRSWETGDRDGFGELTFDHESFAAEFTVYSTDEAETRALLTPAMIAQLLALRQHADRPIFLGFKGRRAYIAVHYNRSLFEPSIASTTSLEAVLEVADDFALAETIVNELDLEARDGEAVDDSFLRQPDAPDDPLKQRLNSGTLEADDLWRLAADSVGVDDSDAAAPRPTETRIDVTHGSDGTSINYGLSFGFVVAFALSLAALIVSLAAARALGRQNGIALLESLVRWLPPVARLDDVVAAAPLIWLLASLVVGLLCAMVWVIRVRRVHIEPDAVLIWRGLRPFPRRYPRPLYGRVVRIEKAVYVGKTGGTSILNPSASPMLASEGEAKWIAAEMRRGLHQARR